MTGRDECEVSLRLIGRHAEFAQALDESVGVDHGTPNERSAYVISLPRCRCRCARYVPTVSTLAGRDMPRNAEMLIPPSTAIVWPVM